MQCPKCKTELPEGSVACSSCGANLNKKWYQKNSPLTVVIMILALCFLGFAVWFFVSSMGGSDNQGNDPSKVLITLEEYNRIENGMTYEEVRDIIGGDGTLMSEVGEKDSPYYTVSYSWEGKGLGANANFTFQGGKLSVKAQFGLE